MWEFLKQFGQWLRKSIVDTSKQVPRWLQAFWLKVHQGFYQSGLADRIIQWLLFNVAIALAPLIATYIHSTLERTPPYSNIWNNLSSKELLIISIALIGDAMGSLYKSDFNKSLRLIAGGICVCLLLFTTILFAKLPDLPQKETLFARENVNLDYITPEALTERHETIQTTNGNNANLLPGISRNIFFSIFSSGSNFQGPRVKQISEV
uniref:Uncharacterized protein n=1 Tax=Cyanothece sp. (strain PCC 7425 / ATCC 29141) TaxID=395961 RepID=B8HWN1_CYAP4